MRMNVEDEDELSDLMTHLVEQAAEIDFDHLQNNRLIQPWIMVRHTGTDKLSLSVVADMPWAEAMDAARNHVRELAPEIDAYLIGFNGSVPTTEGQIPGLFYEVGERNAPQAFQFMVGHGKNEHDEVIMRPEWNGIVQRKDHLLY